MKEFRRVFGACAVVLACCVLFCTAVEADVRKGDGEIGVNFGFASLDLDDSSSGAGRLDARLGFLATNWFGIETQIGYATGTDVDMGTAILNAVFNFRSGPNAMPYVSLGGGTAYVDLGQVDDTDVAYQAATGVRAFGAEGRTGLRLELAVLWDETFGRTNTNYFLTLGFTFAQGREHRHEPTKRQRRFSAWSY